MYSKPILLFKLTYAHCDLRDLVIHFKFQYQRIILLLPIIIPLQNLFSADLFSKIDYQYLVS